MASIERENSRCRARSTETATRKNPKIASHRRWRTSQPAILTASREAGAGKRAWRASDTGADSRGREGGESGSTAGLPEPVVYRGCLGAPPNPPVRDHGTAPLPPCLPRHRPRRAARPVRGAFTGAALTPHHASTCRRAQAACDALTGFRRCLYSPAVFVTLDLGFAGLASPVEQRAHVSHHHRRVPLEALRAPAASWQWPAHALSVRVAA